MSETRRQVFEALLDEVSVGGVIDESYWLSRYNAAEARFTDAAASATLDSVEREIGHDLNDDPLAR